MPNKLELAGQRFGRLVVLEEAGKDGHRAYMWSCRCDCGETSTVRGSLLKQGRVRSCGCGSREATIRRQTTHGMTGTPLYWRWRAMLARTGDPNNREYRNYGGRGITVCERWRDFANFHADMGADFLPGLELDRIDNDGPYSPENCRWATRIEQQRNRRNNHIVEWANRSLTVQDWAELLGLKPNTIITRLRRHWPVDRALSKDVPADVLLRVAVGGNP